MRQQLGDEAIGLADDEQLADDRLVVGGRVREHRVQFHCCVSAGDRVLRQRMEVELAQAVHDAVDGQRTARFVLLLDGVTVIRKSQRRLIEPQL